MYQKDYTEHEKTCQFRVIRCEKCDVIVEEGVEHDCTKSMAAKYEYLEGKLIAVSQKLERQLERAERMRLAGDKGT